jgi:RNA polymerase sigma-70 factor (ECF subfamily)
MLCPGRLLRPDHVLRAGGLLPTAGLLHYGRLLCSRGLLRPLAAEGRLRLAMATPPTTDAIWSHLSEDLRRFIRRRVPDEHVAEDLLQETFLRIHRNIGTLQDAERLAAWVYQIARNVVHDHHRRASTRTVALADAEDVSTADHEPQSGCPDLAWLEEMIQALPDGYRQAVQMAEIERQSQRDVADRLGASLSAAKSRIQRGRAMLKDLLLQCCTFDVDVRGRVRGCAPKPHQRACGGCVE